jgi:major membrane immunogen (membrane-anchored lipoprotein)
MKKLLIITVLLVLPFLLTACIKKPDKSLPQGDAGVQQDDQSNKDDDGSLTGSFLDILKMGKSVKCTGTMEDDEGKMELQVYASGEKSYTESVVTSTEDETFNLYSIFDGEWFYNWGDMLPTATKMKVSDVEELSENFEEPEDTMEPADEKPTGKMMEDLDYKCAPWIPDDSKFVPPADVEFVDMAQMMEEMTEMYGDFESMDDTEMKQKVCDACGLIPDTTQAAECKSVNECK